MNKIKTIGSISISRSSNNKVYINVEDEHSGDNILELSLTLEAYGLLVTGLSGIKGTMEVNPNAQIAKKREVKRVVVPEIKKYQDKKITEQLVLDHFALSSYKTDGWILHDNGTRSQQNNANGYEYIIKRYIPVENPTDMEDMY